MVGRLTTTSDRLGRRETDSDDGLLVVSPRAGKALPREAEAHAVSADAATPPWCTAEGDGCELDATAGWRGGSAPPLLWQPPVLELREAPAGLASAAMGLVRAGCTVPDEEGSVGSRTADWRELAAAGAGFAAGDAAGGEVTVPRRIGEGPPEPAATGTARGE